MDNNYDQQEEGKMTAIMMALWDEDCKKKMTDEGGWTSGGEYHSMAPHDLTMGSDCLTCILWNEIDSAWCGDKFNNVDNEFLDEFICEHSDLEEAMINHMNLSDWRVSKALIPLQAVFRGIEVRWIQKVSKALIPFQALVRARVVRWQYPLYSLMSE